MKVLDQPTCYSTVAERRVLYKTIEPWLMEHGTYHQAEHDKVYRQSSGIPHRQLPARYGVEIRGTLIQAILPRTATTLAIGKSLVIGLQPSVYEAAQDEDSFCGGFMQFCFNRAEDADKPDETIFLDGPDLGDDFETTRVQAPYENYDTQLTDSRRGNPGEGWVLDRLTGFDFLSRGECVALLDIASCLDVLHAEMSQGV